MSRYETILNLGDDFVKLIAKGFIQVQLLDWKVYYEAYLQEMEIQKKNFSKAKKTEAVLTISENYQISQRNVFKIIAFMEGA